MLIAARFSGPGSGKDLLSRAISLIASGLLPFSSFPIPVAPDSSAAVRSDTRNLARASLVALSSIEGLFFDRSAL
jgi:hypothetical protein